MNCFVNAGLIFFIPYSGDLGSLPGDSQPSQGILNARLKNVIMFRPEVKGIIIPATQQCFGGEGGLQ